MALATTHNVRQKRKLAVSEKFDAFKRTRSNQARGRSSATNEDVLDWLCWLDSHGGGTKAVDSTDCAAVGSKSLERCSPGRTCITRYAASTLDKGFASKFECALSETLGMSDAWNDQEKRGNPADSVKVRSAYLAHARVEQRKVGVTVQQARPMLAPVLLQLVRYIMRSSAGDLRTMKERVERSRDIALFVTAFHAVQGGLGLSHALVAQVLISRLRRF